ncbi:MAG TPA: hypothetical protein VK471_02420 [Solirubrobacterales bacterium]|nr:hypothetical protein [Solirubrobacterales bacterium]
MIRNIKVLGLALVAVFAMSAMVASAASAQGKLTSDGPVTLKVTETGIKTANALTAYTHTVACPGSTITGHKYNVTPHGLIPSGETTATLTPHYNQTACEVVDLGVPATVTMNGCDYVVHVLGTVGTKYEVSVDVVCPVGKVIEVEVYSSSSEALKLCTITVKGQAGLKGAAGAPVLAQNTAAVGGTQDDLDIVGTFKGIHAERHGLCKGEGGHADTTNTAEFHVDATVKGYNNLGVETGVTISD